MQNGPSKSALVMQRVVSGPLIAEIARWYTAVDGHGRRQLMLGDDLPLNRRAARIPSRQRRRIRRRRQRDDLAEILVARRPELLDLHGPSGL